jgi:hypothetical protein
MRIVVSSPTLFVFPLWVDTPTSAELSSHGSPFWRMNIDEIRMIFAKEHKTWRYRGMRRSGYCSFSLVWFLLPEESGRSFCGCRRSQGSPADSFDEFLDSRICRLQSSLDLSLRSFFHLGGTLEPSLRPRSANVEA